MSHDKKDKKARASAQHSGLSTQDLEQQVGELTEALQRERADSDNIRRRHEEQITGLKTMVKANVVREFLSVIDNFERALKHAPDTSVLIGPEGVGPSPNEQLPGEHEPDTMRENIIDEPAHKQGFKAIADYIKGVQALVKQFEDTLKQMGVERIKTVGQVFDPRLHEAVSMEEGAGTIEVISEELQAGYSLADDVIRHAMVKVRMQEKHEQRSKSNEQREEKAK
ncbi:MAG: nucleotide exchange factor GrpE [Patescibacteria group bacterium]